MCSNSQHLRMEPRTSELIVNIDRFFDSIDVLSSIRNIENMRFAQEITKGGYTMFDDPKTLITVYKDEVALNLLRKLVETKDDDSAAGSIVGTKDGSVKIVAWEPKLWATNKKAGNTGDIEDKILFIGDIKGVENLVPVIDWKYDKWGIKYGWAGRQAVILTDTRGVAKKADYNAFRDDFAKKTLPQQKESPIWGKLAKDALVTAAFGVIGLGVKTGIDIFHKKEKIQRQLYMYGIMHFYIEHMEEFMNA